jgi:CheY-like chemotaxis protein
VSLDRNGEKGDVLVVDDNRVNRMLVARTLEQFGHRVAFAENGRLALEMLRSRRVDLVLLDIEMPEMNGYQTLEALRADPKLRDVPVVMMSSVDEVDSVARCIEMGAEDYLFGPASRPASKRSVCGTSSASCFGSSRRPRWPKSSSRPASPSAASTSTPP